MFGEKLQNRTGVDMSLALVQIVVSAKAGRYSSGDRLTIVNPANSQWPRSGPRLGAFWDGVGCWVKQIPPLCFG